MRSKRYKLKLFLKKKNLKKEKENKKDCLEFGAHLTTAQVGEKI